MEPHEKVGNSVLVPVDITNRLQAYLNTYKLPEAEQALVTKQVMERITTRIELNPQQGLSFRLAIEEAQFAIDEWLMLSHYRPTVESSHRDEVVLPQRYHQLLSVYTTWLVRTNVQLHRGLIQRSTASPLQAVPNVIENKMNIHPFEFWSLWALGKQAIAQGYAWIRRFFAGNSPTA
ncbi:hypothetical protein BegalDRAFT_1524 [Beggiatoa alba B18LD]|uniref:Uncharacterized protein n=1 Tax=Beggiatoa alba B18LD TaxID=395493 RepID=I3CFL3_9GAMM|nr:hypothetical protein [Beggiatoa alba]EIJ42406.1 hypothetical protein BegalDRAFT_1524 [Beggiatoa alba B18LD]